MASALNEDSVEKKLKTVINTQDSIQSLSLWIIHHKNHHAKIVELWMKVLKKSVQPSHRLTLFYLCNDVVQTCKKKKAYVYNTTFKEYLREAATLVRDHSVKNKMERIFNIWGERGVYDNSFIKSLQSILNGQPAKALRVHKKLEEDEVHNAPISPVSTPRVEVEPKEVVAVAHHSEATTERDAEESARILAEFKPHEMIEQVTSFRRQELEIQLKVSQLSHLKLDASSLEAVRQLKDRAHGNDFSNHFEDSCTKLEDLVKRQSRHLEDQTALIEILCLSETFYEEQYREAKIVANAYKNFGSRINNMKKKLDELRRSMPEPDSPIPSPDMNAPSPSNSPTYGSGSNYGYNPEAPMNYGQGLQKAWAYNGTGSMAGASIMSTGSQDITTFPDSPPLEAPSPEGSPPDLNLEASDNVSLDSRLASFFDRSRPDTSNPPVYTPQLARSTVSSSKLKLGDDDGSTTPLDDETPTTPVQDENLVSPPKRNTPPKKENPIDFLSRLISQTQKTTVKTGTPSFLDSLAMLTTTSKKADNESQQQTAVPQSWAAWKLKTNDSNTSTSQLSSPLSYAPASSLSSSSTHYTPTPTMVPPPIPKPVPPPVSLGMGMNVPPPPPPPFGLAAVISTNFSTPPPIFQHTSPGQKENWPDMKLGQSADHTSSGRVTHSSVLKELVPADGMDAKSGPRLSKESSSSMMDPDAMEIVSEEEEDDDDDEDDDGGGEKRAPKGSETANDAKTEFAQKLKQKTSQGLIKSHVFVPNPERPNLMTLTVSDYLDDEENMLDDDDDDTLMKATPAWSDKSHKSNHKSTSRSRSREKDRSHKHKKKKKHKRNRSSDEDSRLSEGELDDSKAVSSVGSIVKKIESHTSRNSRDSSKSEKYEDRKYDDDRKYDRYDERGYSARGDYRSHKSYRGSKDVKDPVEAYTQAYRDAFFQQYSRGRFNLFPSAPPPMDPRRSGYGKY